jgi:hypothetical protein
MCLHPIQPWYQVGITVTLLRSPNFLDKATPCVARRLMTQPSLTANLISCLPLMRGNFLSEGMLHLSTFYTLIIGQLQNVSRASQAK